MEEWLQAVPDLVSFDSESWALAVASPRAYLLHRPCQWGGTLVKFVLKRIKIQGAPEKTGKVIVRPEVRAAMRDQICPGFRGTTIKSYEFISPGEAILESQTDSLMVRMCSVLFAEHSEGLSQFFDPQQAVALHQRIRRDYPLEGDSALVCWEESGAQEGFLLIRPDSEMHGYFTVIFLMRIPQEKFATWAIFQFRLLMEGAHHSVQYLFNRPSIQRLREIDENFYVTLGIRSFKRGPTMVPVVQKHETSADQTDAMVTIHAGERLGLNLWRCYKSKREKRGKCRFFMSEYLQILVNAMGEEIDAFETLDGLDVVSYQCVVRRSDWARLRTRFFDLYRLAKAAYRRANGGTYAPSILEEAETKFNIQENQAAPPAQASQEMPRWILRKTFLDIEDETDYLDDVPKRRARSAGLLPLVQWA